MHIDDVRKATLNAYAHGDAAGSGKAEARYKPVIEAAFRAVSALRADADETQAMIDGLRALQSVLAPFLTPVCEDCLAGAHCGSEPDFPWRPTGEGEACQAADHDEVARG